MAISTGDIESNALTTIMARIAVRKHVNLTLPQICFIFKKKYEIDGDDIRTDLQDVGDWLDALPEVDANDMFVYVNWLENSVHIATDPAPSP